MDYLLHPRNLKILESFCLAKTLFAFDYDGTLAPIATNPQDAVMKETTIKLLRKLSTVSPIAIITGRSIADIQALLPVKPDYLIGNHGAEGTHTPEELEEMRALSRHWLKELHGSFPLLEKLGILVEDKTFSLAFHYRTSTNIKVAEGALDLILSDLRSSRITRGKCVVNVLPVNSFNKGIALEKIMKENQYQFGVYFGDDQTDEDVFHYNNSRLLSVKIGTEPTEAKYFLHSQDEIDSALNIINNFLNNGFAAV